MNKETNKVLRILQITECLSAAGIESFIMNNYRKMNLSKVQFDFLVLRNEREFYDDEINKMGGKKYCICRKDKNTLIRILKESIDLYHFLKKNPYSILHIHYTTPLRAPYLYAAKKAGVKVRIYHSHSAEVSGKNKIKVLIYNFMKKKIKKWATHWFACSKAAALWMFPQELCDNNQVKIIYNGIDINQYKFNIKYRKEIREQLKLNDQFVLVHTGRFLEQKNQTFIIDIFNEIKKNDKTAILLLLGEGELKPQIEQKVKNMNLNNSVMFLGVRNDVYKILSASDCYIMPSLYEGLPVASVEAQCSSLPCILSENITDEIKLIDKVIFLSLNDSYEKWANAIMQFKNNNTRKDESHIIRKNGYDSYEVASKLQDFYLRCGE